MVIDSVHICSLTLPVQQDVLRSIYFGEHLTLLLIYDNIYPQQPQQEQPQPVERDIDYLLRLIC